MHLSFLYNHFSIRKNFRDEIDFIKFGYSIYTEAKLMKI